MNADDEGTTETAPASPPTSGAGRGELDADSIGRAIAEAASREPSHPRWWRDARRRRLLALADCAAVAAGLLVAVPTEQAIWLLAFLPVGSCWRSWPGCTTRTIGRCAI
jgi:hypothetical protein